MDATIRWQPRSIEVPEWYPAGGLGRGWGHT